MEDSIVTQIAAVRGQPGSALRQRWQEVFGHLPPRQAGTDFLRRALAYRLQETAIGGLSRATQKRIAQLNFVYTRATTDKLRRLRPLKPGTRVLREWKGEMHEVCALDNGFAYRGERYESLSVIARKITGTQWNGPLFFGLRKSGAAQEVGHGQ